QMHNPSLDDIRKGELFVTAEQFRMEGLVEWYGVSVDSASEALAVLDMCDLLGLPGLASIQLVHSFVTKIGSDELMERAKSNGVGMVAGVVLCRGLLTSFSLVFDNASATAVKKLVDRFGRAQLERLRANAKTIVERYGSSLLDAAIAYSLATPGITVTLVG